MNEKIVRPEFGAKKAGTSVKASPREPARGPGAVAALPEKRDPRRAQLRIDLDSDPALLMRHLKIAREMLQACELIGTRATQRCKQSGPDQESGRCARDQIRALFQTTSRALNSRPRD